MSVAGARTGGAEMARGVRRIERGVAVRGVIIAALFAFVFFAVPTLVGADWLTTFASVSIYSIVACGFGILYGRVGMISLGQVALLSIGCWIGTRLSYATSLPFPLLLLVTGLITLGIGALVGLPSLRLSGLYLALITLMFAGATTIVLSVTDFPNGGHGFTGRTSTGALTTSTPPVRRPSMAVGDTAFFRYILIVTALMFLLALVHVSAKPGRAWAAIRESEPAALAAGVNITVYKMWAFALASFMTGVAGCLLAAQVGVPRAITFQTQDSLTLAATSLIGGIFSIWGAVVAGIFNQLLPFVFQAQWGISSNFLLILFGVGLIQVLLTAPGGLADQFPKDMAKLGRLIWRGVRGLGGGTKAGVVIEVSGLTVKFAGVTPIDDVTVQFPGGTCGLIGPNGAGKTTFFNVLSGFVRPAAGSITAFGDNMLKMADYRRARWGLRRTFQTEMAIEQLSIYDNVAMIHEHSGAKRSARRVDVLAAVDFVGLEASPKAKVGELGARERRLVEVARAVVGRPRVVLLDEPAAGLPDEQTAQLGDVIHRIPEEFGALVILVDHDMSLVSHCCETTAVLDFGKLIASGPTAEVLRNEHVIRAYLGTETEL